MACVNPEDGDEVVYTDGEYFERAWPVGDSPEDPTNAVIAFDKESCTDIKKNLKKDLPKTRITLYKDLT